MMTTPIPAQTQTTTKVFCLLSGGIDSSTTLAIARDEFPESDFETVTFNYGQRHAKEISSARKISAHYDAKHTIIPIQNLLTGMLVEKEAQNEEIPNVSYSDLAPGISPTYVSFRNGTMLAILAARAQSWVMAMEKSTGEARTDQRQSPPNIQATIYCGVHADDGVNWAYPDCTPEFIGPLGTAIFIGTYQKVRLRTPLLFDTKADVVTKGLVLGTPYEHTWSCYKGEELHCGVCPTCRSRKEAFVLNGRTDPVEYAA